MNKPFTKREFMLLLNGVAVTADNLYADHKGEFPNSNSFSGIDNIREFALKAYNEQPFITFDELNALFTRLYMMATDQHDKLMDLPPTSEYIH